MATDFFNSQDLARRNTRRLIALFVLGMIGLTLTAYALVYFLVAFNDSRQPKSRTAQAPPRPLVMPELLALTVLGVGAVVGGGSLVKVAQLKGGGKGIALSVGGEELTGQPRDRAERRLLNIVEEMALAAGVPVPPVFVLPEDGINAFAAGYSPSDAVVAVSRGCLNYLTRDELQGVVAHEFSHILNGDMRLNIRIIALVGGLLVLSEVGRLLMRATSNSSSNSNNKKDNSAALLLIGGLGLFIIGLIGVFFGNIIKAAVSRQREYLADASAVQFTRNPDGIAGALKKIGGLESGSDIRNDRAAEVNHLFFCEIGKATLLNWLATHPPLEDRIRRLDPQFDGVYPEVRLLTPRAEEAEEVKAKRPAFPVSIPGLPQIPGAVLAGEPLRASPRVARVSRESLDQAHRLQAALPADLAQAIEEPFAARLAVFALLLDPAAEMRSRQIALLNSALTEPERRAFAGIAPVVIPLPETTWLSLVDRCLPALRRMSRPQYESFRAVVGQLMDVDPDLRLFEYALAAVLKRHLDEPFGKLEHPRIIYRDRAVLESDAAVILSRLAQDGERQSGDAETAFALGWKVFAGTASPALVPVAECPLTRFDASLEKVRQATPALKKLVVDAAAAVIQADAAVTAAEIELLRVICARFDCPLPPIGV